MADQVWITLQLTGERALAGRFSTMRRKKETSPALRLGTTRLAAISSIDPALDLGNELTLAAYRVAVADTQTKLEGYNQLLSQLDEARVLLRASERALAGRSKRMLAGVVARYGSNSVEYEKAGGTRDSERRRPSGGAKPASTTTLPAAA